MKLRIFKALTCTIIAAAPLAAQDKVSKFWLGGQLSLAIPSRHHVENHEHKNITHGGLGTSVFGQLSLSDNLSVRGRVDYITQPFGFGGTVTTASWVKSVDGVFSFHKQDKGLYLLGTIGLINTSWSYEYHNPPFESGSGSDSALCYGAGVGYYLTKHLGAEAKYIIGPKKVGVHDMHMNLKYLDPNDSYDSTGSIEQGHIYHNNYFQLSLTLRF